MRLPHGASAPFVLDARLSIHVIQTPKNLLWANRYCLLVDQTFQISVPTAFGISGFPIPASVKGSTVLDAGVSFIKIQHQITTTALGLAAADLGVPSLLSLLLNFFAKMAIPVAKAQPQKPGALWRAASTITMASTGMICRSILYGLNSLEVVGLDNFLKLLDARKDVEARQRGLLTGESTCSCCFPISYHSTDHAQ